MHFLVNDDPVALNLIRGHGHRVDVVNLGSDNNWEASWLLAHPSVKVWVNDRLDTSEDHANRVKSCGVRLATFDDRGAGAAVADLHIAALVFDDTGSLLGRRILSGVDYLVLDPKLAGLRRVRETASAWLVTMGGSDTWGVTPRIMDALLSLGQGASVVLGPSFKHVADVEAVQARSPSDFFTVHHRGVPSLADEMARHDLAITGGGMTPFQANAMGLPCIVVANEHFEVPVGRALERLGGSVFAGFHQDLDLSVLHRRLQMAQMSQAGMRAVDLLGCDRVVKALRNLAEEGS
ncbi:hypothetical protein [Pseudothauera rhizosphaerae]|uniref:hypothetical protein n=1 Tax=Pseudothauera rhizosphaerae TaxID=2565932 RepID=UPI001B3B26EB|nr:hypothetical protein [Pseudothauera rhizosphaerae]